jgi:hypothetical protein
MSLKNIILDYSNPQLWNGQFDVLRVNTLSVDDLAVDALTIGTSILPLTGGLPWIGTTSLPFKNVASISFTGSNGNFVDLNAININNTNFTGTNVYGTTLRCNAITGSSGNFDSLNTTNLKSTNITNTTFNGTNLFATNIGCNSLTGNNGTLSTLLNTGNLTLNGTLINTSGNGIQFPNAGAGSLTALTYYEEYIDSAFQLQGAWSSPANITIRITRVGKIISLTTPAFSHVSNANLTLFSTIGIPTRFRPLELISQFISIVDNSGINVGRFEINTSGILTLYADNGSAGFTNSGDAGTEYGTTMSWNISS